jgi:hypothetical protein
LAALQSHDAAAFFDFPRLFGGRRSFVEPISEVNSPLTGKLRDSGFEIARGTAKTGGWRAKLRSS